MASAVLAAGPAGCGGNRGPSAKQLARGKTVFARSCSGCHSLTGHDTAARGGDLAIAHLDTRDLAGFIRVMPVRLTSADVDAVAAYVHAAASRRPR